MYLRLGEDTFVVGPLLQRSATFNIQLFPLPSVFRFQFSVFSNRISNIRVPARVNVSVSGECGVWTTFGSHKIAPLLEIALCWLKPGTLLSPQPAS